MVELNYSGFEDDGGAYEVCESIERFEDLHCWQLARQLTRRICETIDNSDRFARDWGLKDQITRAAGSIMHNCLAREITHALRLHSQIIARRQPLYRLHSGSQETLSAS